MGQHLVFHIEFNSHGERVLLKLHRPIRRRKGAHEGVLLFNGIGHTGCRRSGRGKWTKETLTNTSYRSDVNTACFVVNEFAFLSVQWRQARVIDKAFTFEFGPNRSSNIHTPLAPSVWGRFPDSIPDLWEEISRRLESMWAGETNGVVG